MHEICKQLAICVLVQYACARDMQVTRHSRTCAVRMCTRYASNSPFAYLCSTHVHEICKQLAVRALVQCACARDKQATRHSIKTNVNVRRATAAPVVSCQFGHFNHCPVLINAVGKKHIKYPPVADGQFQSEIIAKKMTPIILCIGIIASTKKIRARRICYMVTMGGELLLINCSKCSTKLPDEC